MARDIEFYITAATEAFEAGFLSKAAQKRALDDVSRAFRFAYDAVMQGILDDARQMFAGAAHSEAIERARQDWINAQGYYSIPSYPHEYRAEKHGERFTRYGQRETAEQLVDLRNAIKAAEIAPAPVKDETKERVETIRRSIVEEMERRRAQYVEALEIGRLFGGLPVSVNAHWVHGHKGTVFLRHFFYLRGKLTPLNTIIAAADTLKREKEGR